MMQQVATSNADIAAFAANTPQSDQQDPSFAKDFGKLLQQHQDARESFEGTKKESSLRSKEAFKTSPDKLEQKQQKVADVADKDNQISSELEQSSIVEGDKNAGKDTEEKLPSLKNEISTINTAAAQKNKDSLGDTNAVVGGEESADSERLAVNNTELAEQVLSEINELVKQFEYAKNNAQNPDMRAEELSAVRNLNDEEEQAEQIESQDWSSLVEKLHTLASSSSENSKNIAVEDKRLLADDVANLVQQTTGEKAISPDELVAKLLDAQGDLAKTDEKIESTLPPALANVVTQILNEVDVRQISDTSPEAEVQIDALVNKLASLQEAFESRKTAINSQAPEQPLGLNQGLGQGLVASVGQETSLTAKILDSNGQVADTEQLTDTLNKSLISTVLKPASDAKESVNIDTLKQSGAVVPQGEKLVSPAIDLEIAEVQTQSQEIIPTQLGGKESSPRSSLEVLAGMPAEKLDKALNNLLQRLSAEQSTNEVQNAQLSQQQVAGVAGTQVEQSALVHTNKDFIAALKAGVDEFKAQLAQGREPGIDLKDLVADVMSKSADTSASIAKQAQQTEIAVKGFSQVLDFAQQLNGALEQHQSNIVSQNNYMVREAGQGQLDQLKQFQAQNSQFDKAVNISKPEGHQQLAEKVRWMVNAKQMVAEIRLDPAELGSMQVKVSVTGESANISFVVQSQQARDAMESATPRLREMLAEKGIELGQSSVKQDQGQGPEDGKGQLAGQQHRGAEQGGEDSNELSNEAFTQQPIINGALGGIDYFV